jgi:Leucine-rich repeat (LRR) protein
MNYHLLITIFMSLQIGVESCQIIGCTCNRTLNILCEEKLNKSFIPVIPPDFKKVNLYLKYKLIKTLPDFIFTNVSFGRLELSYNSIELISNQSFSKINSINSLVLSSNQIKAIDFVFTNKTNSFTCNMFSKMAILDLSRNKLEYLRNDSFECLIDIQLIYLDSNPIIQIETSTFYKLLKLIFIRIFGASLKSFDLIFHDQTSLQTFSFKNNKISLNKKVIFDKLTKLQTLELDSNNINYIYDNTFEGLRSLKFLGLASNDITYLEENSFMHLRNLRLLDLSNNKIKTINPLIFKNLIFLNTLYMKNNGIIDIKNNTFMFLNTLNDLDLSYNNIYYLDHSFVKNLALITLDLRNNKLKLINNNSFKNLKFLKQLYLTNNEISNIEFNSFEDMNELQDLHLQNNSISKIQNGFVKKSFRNLYLEYNKIDLIENDSFINNSIVHVFLKSNHIKILYSNIFSNLRMTKLWTLSHNKNTKIEKTEFPFFPHYEIINLSYNDLNSIKFDRFQNLSLKLLDITFKRLIVIKKIKLEGFIQ